MCGRKMQPSSHCHVSDQHGDEGVKPDGAEGMERTQVCDGLTVLTCQLGQPTSGHPNISGIRMHLPHNF